MVYNFLNKNHKIYNKIGITFYKAVFLYSLIYFVFMV